MTDLKDVLIELGYRPQLLNGEYRFPALYRGGNSSQAVSMSATTGQWYDHVELRGGNFASFLKLHNRDADDVQIAPAAKKIERPTIFKRSSLDLLFRQHIYWERRGISAATMDLFKAGVCHSGKLYNRGVVPVFSVDGERILGFAGRKLDDTKAGPKWKLLGRKGFWIFPAHLNDAILRETREVILVESIGDCLSLWEAEVKNSLVLFGLNLSGKLLSYLLSLNPRKIYVSTNNDETGRGQEAAAKIVGKLGKLFGPSRIEVRIPSAPFKDFGEMTAPQISQFWS